MGSKEIPVVGLLSSGSSGGYVFSFSQSSSSNASLSKASLMSSQPDQPGPGLLETVGENVVSVPDPSAGIE